MGTYGILKQIESQLNMIQSQYIEIDLFAQGGNGRLDGGFVLLGNKVSQAAHQRQQIGSRQRRLSDVPLQGSQPNFADFLAVLRQDPGQSLPPLRVFLQQVESVFGFDDGRAQDAALGRTAVHFGTQRKRTDRSRSRRGTCLWRRVDRETASAAE